MKKRKNIRHDTEEQCSVEFCTEKATILDKCKNCYNAEHRWARRSPADRYRRMQQLKKFEARMERLAPVKLRWVK